MTSSFEGDSSRFTADRVPPLGKNATKSRGKVTEIFGKESRSRWGENWRSMGEPRARQGQGNLLAEAGTIGAINWLGV